MVEIAIRKYFNPNWKWKLLCVICIVSFFSCKNDATSDGKSNTELPNIIFLVTDDAGYSDYSFMGSKISTPHIDKLASKSFIFPNFYNNGRCSPTRASLLTGHYPQKVGVGELSRPSAETKLPGYLGFLSLDFPILPELLQPLGYHTIMAGKWHLGGQLESRVNEKNKWPLQRGFDSFFGIIGGSVRSHFKPSSGDRYIYGNDRIPVDVFEEDFYSSDGLMDHVIESINENSRIDEKPFFVYLPFFAPHLPLEAPQELVDKYIETYERNHNPKTLKQLRLAALKKKGYSHADVKANLDLFKSYHDLNKESIVLALATHAAMMENIDSNIGRLVKTLKANGKFDNTLIFLLSDNGVSAAGVADAFNSPYFGRKGMLWEGGIKTPLIVSWPSLNKTKRVISQAWHVMDIMPTIIDILGEDKQNATLSGRSFYSLLQNGKAMNNLYIEREFLFWSDRKQSAGINKDGMKWIREDGIGNYLFDLNNDPTEIKNIAGVKTALVREFRAGFLEHRTVNNVEPFRVVEKNRLTN